MAVIIERATIGDYNDIAQLVHANRLPTEGLRGCMASALVARDNGEIVGSAALEVYANGVLLRSVAVDTRWRGLGLGRRLTDAALTLARERGAPAAYLLTTTAGDFFPRFGFAPIDRADVPEDVRASIEFTSSCPSSALVMRVLLA